MGKNSAYADKLLDPRWQRLRLEIFERDHFACTYCSADDKTLHVHHAYYEWGRDPWDYDVDTLRTLCVGCHERLTAETRSLRSYMNLLSVDCDFDPSDLQLLLSWVSPNGGFCIQELNYLLHLITEEVKTSLPRYPEQSQKAIGWSISALIEQVPQTVHEVVAKVVANGEARNSRAPQNSGAGRDA